MPIIVRKPTEEEIKSAVNWPTWNKEVSEFDWSYDTQEQCLIISGRAEVAAKDGSTVSFGPGDFVIFPVGLECRWKILEAIEKKYNFG